MNLKVEIGHPEILLVCGTLLIAHSSFSVGLTMAILGFFGAFARSALRIQKMQEEAEARQQLLQKVNSAGEELGGALAALFDSFSGVKKNSDNSFH